MIFRWLAGLYVLGLIVFLRLVVAGWWFWFCRFWFGFALRFVGYLFCGCYAVSHVRLTWLLDGDSCEAGGICVVQVDSGFLGFVVGAWCWFSWLGRFLALGGGGGLVFLVWWFWDFLGLCFLVGGTGSSWWPHFCFHGVCVGGCGCFATALVGVEWFWLMLVW